MPTPYRVPVFDLIADEPGIDLTVLYSSEREPNRHWTTPQGRVRTIFLKQRIIVLGENKYIHVNWGVWRELRRIRPHVVVTNGFNITDLLVLLYAWRSGARAVCQIDGTLESERTLTGVHRLVRRIGNHLTHAYAGPSESTMRLFSTFGARPSDVFWSPLAIDNAAFRQPALTERRFDLLFSGRLTEVKNPVFAVRAAGDASRRLGRPVRLLVAGRGELEDEMRAAASAFTDLQVEFRGFVQQGELPELYGSAKLFLFPTNWDPWGVVANEAAAAGTPTIVSPHAGAAGELIRNDREGLVVPLDLDLWVEAIVGLLRDTDHWHRLSTGSAEHVRDYSWRAAAAGFVDAIDHAAQPRA
ncbi:glycosyltransferase family 4 protein [uncultured Amnibacterium sp.]|uniref:glycosyltransferase family 4 protein n=1 Tax=uncultured Amnibacterium sp. TaxID=1631851 RepID=UPI0035CCA360